MIEIMCLNHPRVVDETFVNFITSLLKDDCQHNIVRCFDPGNDNRLVYYLSNQDVANNLKAITDWCAANKQNIKQVQIGYGNGQIPTQR